MGEIIIFGENSEINRRLSLMLVGEGYLTRIFNRQDKMSDYLKQQFPSMIIFECQPDCKEEPRKIDFINTMVADSSLPLLLIISREQIPTFNRSLQNDHVSYMVKPILHLNLVTRVRELLEKQDQQ